MENFERSNAKEWEERKDLAITRQQRQINRLPTWLQATNSDQDRQATLINYPGPERVQPTERRHQNSQDQNPQGQSLVTQTSLGQSYASASRNAGAYTKEHGGHGSRQMERQQTSSIPPRTDTHKLDTRATPRPPHPTQVSPYLHAARNNRGPFKIREQQVATNGFHYGLSEEALIQAKTFRKEPQKPLLGHVIGFFPWPLKDVPLENLGSEYIGLDILRLHFQSHIVYSDDFGAFKIYADNSEKFVEISKEIGRILHENVAIGLEPTKIFIADSPKSASQRVLRFDVHDPTTPSHAAGLEPSNPATIIQLTTAPFREAIPPRWTQVTHSISMANVHIFKDALIDHLSSLRYYKKHVEMRCLFGIFVFQSYSWVPEEALDQPAVPFVKKLKDQRTKGALYRVSPKARLLEKVVACESFFAPRKGPGPLAEVRPHCQAIFTFSNNARTGSGDLQLIVSASYNETKLATIETREWKTLENRSNQGRILEIHMVRLQSGFSWKFEVNIEPTSTDVKEEDLRFARQVELISTEIPLEPDYAEPLFRFPASRRLKAFHQKLVWQYRLIGHKAYIFEVVKNNSFGVPTTTMSTKDAPKTSQWEALIRSDRWEPRFTDHVSSHGSSNEVEKIEVGKFFPTEREDVDEDSKLSEFLKIMNKVASVLSEAAT